ncbi:MAG: DUF1223 domain-containing protein, partial [Rhodomicrobium sp.]|nr:DUF1223 domain-containing protein [Rhodomicrobium sp.]
YLGWKDTLARPENAERQRSYAAAHGDGQVYTPQIIVNGLKTCVGSDLASIEAALKSTALTLGKEAVPLSVRREGRKLTIETGAAPAGSPHKTGKVWVAAVVHSVPVAIGRGENAGRTVTYTNVVRYLIEAGRWEGAPTSYAVPLGSIPKDGDMIVVFLQTDTLGPIVAATRIKG